MRPQSGRGHYSGSPPPPLDGSQVATLQRGPPGSWGQHRGRSASSWPPPVRWAGAPLSAEKRQAGTQRTGNSPELSSGLMVK